VRSDTGLTCALCLQMQKPRAACGFMYHYTLIPHDLQNEHLLTTSHGIEGHKRWL